MTESDPWKGRAFPKSLAYSDTIGLEAEERD